MGLIAPVEQNAAHRPFFTRTSESVPDALEATTCEESLVTTQIPPFPVLSGLGERQGWVPADDADVDTARAVAVASALVQPRAAA